MATLRDTNNNFLCVSQIVTAVGAANAAVTATLPAAGANLFHYIAAVEVVRAATALLAGTAVLTITSTNLPGNPAWSVGNAMVAGGSSKDIDKVFDDYPLKSLVANTATTIVCPVPGAAVLWRVNVYYFIAPA